MADGDRWRFPLPCCHGTWAKRAPRAGLNWAHCSDERKRLAAATSELARAAPALPAGKRHPEPPVETIKSSNLTSRGGRRRRGTPGCVAGGGLVRLSWRASVACAGDATLRRKCAATLPALTRRSKCCQPVHSIPVCARFHAMSVSQAYALTAAADGVECGAACDRVACRGHLKARQTIPSPAATQPRRTRGNRTQPNDSTLGPDSLRDGTGHQLPVERLSWQKLKTVLAARTRKIGRVNTRPLPAPSPQAPGARLSTRCHNAWEAHSG